MSAGSNTTTGCASSPVNERRSTPCSTTNGSAAPSRAPASSATTTTGPISHATSARSPRRRRPSVASSGSRRSRAGRPTTSVSTIASAVSRLESTIAAMRATHEPARGRHPAEIVEQHRRGGHRRVGAGDLHERLGDRVGVGVGREPHEHRSGHERVDEPIGVRAVHEHPARARRVGGAAVDHRERLELLAVEFDRVGVLRSSRRPTARSPPEPGTRRSRRRRRAPRATASPPRARPAPAASRRRRPR